MTGRRMGPVTALLLSLLPSERTIAADRFDVSTCVDVQIGGDQLVTWQCLNAALARQVAAEKNRQAQMSSALAATIPSGPTALGLFDEAATAERLGDSFGHSVIPQRPVETYRNPLESRK